MDGGCGGRREGSRFAVSPFPVCFPFYVFTLPQVNREGSYQGEPKCIPTTSEKSDSLFNTHSTFEDYRNLGKMKLNEPGRKKTRYENERTDKRTGLYYC